MKTKKCARCRYELEPCMTWSDTKTRKKYCSKYCLDRDSEIQPAVIEPAEEVKPTTPIDPAHYRSHPSGIECIEITRHMNFCLGNAMKYIWRAGLKGEALEDLRKAQWYIAEEIKRMEADK